mmetsp:Transcript_28595/g.60107  ORF Transcript_28595/g.60107 Transcript_28595/m.60107 type:complete len:85 (-) Transcript_28595:921-1175(-)
MATTTRWVLGGGSGRSRRVCLWEEVEEAEDGVVVVVVVVVVVLVVGKSSEVDKSDGWEKEREREEWERHVDTVPSTEDPDVLEA